MPRPDPRRFAYADPARILRESLAAFLPPQPITVAEYAERNRWVKSPARAHLERWDNATAPYLREPMEVLSSEEVSTVALVGPGGCGKTMVCENWLLHTVADDPADMLWYAHTEPGISAYVKGRIDPMVEAHDGMREALGHRSSDDAINFKRFRGMRVEFLSFTNSNLVNKHVARIVADEVDAYDDAIGDPETVLNIRRQAAGLDSKMVMLSHPDLATGLDPERDWKRGIMSVYAKSDRRTWWWPCPHCNGWSSPNPGTARQMVVDYPQDAPLDEIAATAALLCPVCDERIENHHRHPMLQAGKWMAMGEEIDLDGKITGERVRRTAAGFWIVGVMSPFTMGGIGAMARAREEARREAAISGEDKSLRQVMVKQWGIPHQPPKQVGSIEAQVLVERADPALILRVVPEGCRVLTVAADSQANRFELLVRGWGPGMESWVIDHRSIPAEPATSPEDWDKLLRLLATLEYPLADGSGRVMRVRAAIYDSAGGAGVTEQAYAAWLRARRAGLARKAGLINGRDAWMLAPAKGSSRSAAPRIALSYPDGSRKDRKAAARGEIPVLFFNPNQAKDALAAQLERAEPGPGTVHFPAALKSEARPHVWFEQLAAEQRDNRRGTWSKIASHLRNEVWDLMLMTEAAARLHGLHRQRWDHPPAWAAPWDANSMVRKPEPAPTPEAAVAATAVALGALLRGQPVPAPRVPAVPLAILARPRGVRSAGVTV